MSKYKVLYIDDDASKLGFKRIEPMIDTLEESEKINITTMQSGTFDKVSTLLMEKIKEFDAVIFDYQLDDAANDDGEKGNIKAPALAQHLRTEATSIENGLKDLPFILCSTDDKLQKTYTSDKTSHDLFDLRFRKDKGDLLEVSEQIVGLIEGYKLIESTNDFNAILNYDINKLDERIFSRFTSGNSHTPPHEYARTILKDLLYINGPLIDSETLAARLGIDFEKSNDWDTVKNEVFKDAKYSGSFSNGWERWWMNSITEMFLALTGENLASVAAPSRLQLLIDSTDLQNLTLAERIEGCNSYRYWTVCKSYNKPLDPREGFKAASKQEPKPWQEYSYISKDGAIKRINFDEGLDVHPTDYERYNLTIAQLKK